MLYLLYEVLPLFQSAKVEQIVAYQIQDESTNLSTSPPLYLGVEEQNEVGLRLSNTGAFVFYPHWRGAAPSRLKTRPFSEHRARSFRWRFGLPRRRP